MRQGQSHTEQSKQRIAAALRGKPKSDTHKAKLRAYHTPARLLHDIAVAWERGDSRTVEALAEKLYEHTGIVVTVLPS